MSVAQGETFSDGFATGWCYSGGIAGYNSMPNAPSGDLYADVGTRGPCANMYEKVIIGAILALIAWYVAKTMRDHGEGVWDSIVDFFKKDMSKGTKEANPTPACSGVAA